jgi:hypothetical protein
LAAIDDGRRRAVVEALPIEIRDRGVGRERAAVEALLLVERYLRGHERRNERTREAEGGSGEGILHPGTPTGKCCKGDVQF